MLNNWNTFQYMFNKFTKNKHLHEIYVMEKVYVTEQTRTVFRTLSLVNHSGNISFSSVRVHIFGSTNSRLIYDPCRNLRIFSISPSYIRSFLLLICPYSYLRPLMILSCQFLRYSSVFSRWTESEPPPSLRRNFLLYKSYSFQSFKEVLYELKNTK